MRRGTAVVAVIAVVACAADARAQSPEDRVNAAALFREGKAMMDSGRFADGCRKLEASRQLDPVSGTILNLAYCHEQEGKTATAMSEYDEAIALARRDNRKDRVDFANAQMTALAPKLSRLTIVVPEASAFPELVIARDGSAIPRAAWNTAIAVDPGEHAIAASAKGRQSWTAKVTIGANADKQSLTVPLLDVAPETAPRPPPPEPPPPIVTAPTVATTAAPPVAPPPRTHARATLGYGVGALGVFSLGVGTYFGLRALSKKSDSDRTCPTATTCDGAGYSANQEAKTAADVATITIALGLVGIGLGTYLVLTDRADARDTTARRLRVDARAAPGGGSLWLSGLF